MSSISKLRKKMNSLKGFDQDTVLSIMVLTRESLEELNQKNNYAHLNFYCNWCVHSELKQSPVCFEILRKITDILISKPANDLNLPWYTDAIAETLDLKKLRLQLIAFFEQNSIPVDIFKNYNYWLDYSLFLRNIVSLKPIKFPSDLSTLRAATKRIYDEIEAIANNNSGVGAKSLSVITEIDLNKHWHCNFKIESFKPFVDIVGPFEINEMPF